ncbi:histidine--tRNA ligase [Polluticaenibacter yanchengensis]|uniref:Histidine--tRNA ligase n=1 Tax=Polluticaenibacter yanchengensis TaxID=3014562 RepID=A0ABT4UI35_9BACT|nr:histidine--tRNA ligase [Chitinophagaceae bacterium LY-5]
MAKVNVNLPQGTRDFSPEVLRKRQYIINTIRSVFEVYGFEPLETPAMENLNTLMGKYGEEGDKLIFKILNNGLERVEKHEKARAAFDKVLDGKNTPDLTERALRYDLTIPFARFVAMNHAQLTFPFKRYQIQPVWRADKPQRGRYREFYQCDADMVGSKSLLNEVELTNIYASVFDKLNVRIQLKINSRKILAALAEVSGGADKMVDITVAIDKLDKIGLEKVQEELQQRGLNDSQIETITRYLQITGSNAEKIAAMKALLGDNETAKTGFEEIEYVLNQPEGIATECLDVDFTLARGLNYYTGIIFEVKALDARMGSIGGGGRYDDLTGLFGVPNIPGVGISFGLDRIYDVLEELNQFPANVSSGTQVLFFNLGDAESKKAFELMQQLRNAGIASELYHENSKFDKQFKYAEKKAIPYAVILGSKELENGEVILKNLQARTEERYSFDKLAEALK